VIPLAGIGSRMRAVGAKGLLRINGTESALGRCLQAVRRRWPDVPVYLVVGHDQERVRRQVGRWRISNCHFIENTDYAQVNVADSLKLAFQHASPGNLLVIYGDLVFARDALANLPLLDASVLYGETSYLRHCEVGLCVDEKGCVGNMAHQLPIRWAHIAYMQSLERKLFVEIVEETPGGRFFLAYEIFNRMIDRGGRFVYRPFPGWLVELDCRKDVVAAGLALRLRENESSKCE
jgi:hypothetical protein